MQNGVDSRVLRDSVQRKVEDTPVEEEEEETPKVQAVQSSDKPKPKPKVKPPSPITPAKRMWAIQKLREIERSGRKIGERARKNLEVRAR